MKILLDIDGVMVTTPSWRSGEILSDGFSVFNPIAVSNLNRIITETNATIILTSSHKLNYSIEEWINIFNKRGVKISSIQRLETNSLNIRRIIEIINWFSSNKNEKFVIIDDDTSLNDLTSYIKNRCVITKQLIGLSVDDATKAIDILTQ